MTETAYFFEGTGVNDNGPYTSDEFATFMKAQLGAQAWQNNDQAGIFWGSGGAPALGGGSAWFNAGETVVPGALTDVIVQTGALLVNGRLHYNDAPVTINLAANSSGNPRIDAIIARLDLTATVLTVRLDKLQGTPAASPVPPTLTQNPTIWEVAIAYVTVENGVTQISSDDIIPCGLPLVTGAAGAIIMGNVRSNSAVMKTGDAVRLRVADNPSSDVRATLLTARTTQATPFQADGAEYYRGVWIGYTTAFNQWGAVVIQGLTPVNTGTATSLATGSPLIATATAGQVTTVNDGGSWRGQGAFGMLVSNRKTAANARYPLALAYIDNRFARRPAIEKAAIQTFSAATVTIDNLELGLYQSLELQLQLFRSGSVMGSGATGQGIARVSFGSGGVVDTTATNYFNVTTFSASVTTVENNGASGFLGLYFPDANAPAGEIAYYTLRIVRADDRYHLTWSGRFRRANAAGGNIAITGGGAWLNTSGPLDRIRIVNEVGTTIAGTMAIYGYA